MSEIVQVFGGVRSEEGKFAGMGIALGPEIKRLAADDEGTIVELEDCSELANDLGR